MGLMELTDGIVTLRPFAEGDAPAVARACADPETQRFIPGMPSPYTEADARAYIGLTREWEAAGTNVPRAIVEAASGELLGSIDVRLGETGTIGYWMGPWARRRGHATRALALLSRWAVTEAGVERLELTTHPDNIASQRVAEKAGFAREGILRGYIRFAEGRRDSVMFSLLPGDLA
jgi:RimJ/RimL family protein N-acetyltransferase